MKHITVLKTEAVDLLALTSKATAVDCTLGAGGHSREMLKHIGSGGTLLSLDADQVAVDEFEPIKSDATHVLRIANFKDLKSVSHEVGISSYDAILADLGWRTDQFESGNKGFSFLQNEPLLMTFGSPEDAAFTAHEIVNEWAEESIADIIYGYGEERAARKIAGAIVAARNELEITTSAQLAEVVADSVGIFYKRSRLHPATKTFQALRIAVNDELGVLKTLLSDGFELLAPGGRMAIISFHSLEDRIVKQYFRELTHDQKGTRVTKKPLIPSDEELQTNPRARSAKLRCIEKI